MFFGHFIWHVFGHMLNEKYQKITVALHLLIVPIDTLSLPIPAIQDGNNPL